MTSNATYVLTTAIAPAAKLTIACTAPDEHEGEREQREDGAAREAGAEEEDESVHQNPR